MGFRFPTKWFVDNAFAFPDAVIPDPRPRTIAWCYHCISGRIHTVFADVLLVGVKIDRSKVKVYVTVATSSQDIQVVVWPSKRRLS
jgi:hypothetical protein